MKRLLSAIVPFVYVSLFLVHAACAEDAPEYTDKDLAADLKTLQGSWELYHGGPGAPTTRSVKIIKGNVETLRRYNLKTGKLGRESKVEFKLSKFGGVRVFTFYPVGGSPERGLSYVYKIEGKNFYDIAGLLDGDKYRNYQPTLAVYHWVRTPVPEPEPK